ncbi:hypothetical protein KI387_004913 [Taxus chinensis]|uniref:Major facilitator superfamily (MFS) profile domain-containing protein n=1 Tax=Taxus chinensis TaxID=29808 RepID=A0AA38GQG5_TAXCH|nr:hypothetical protein KI387_004913 [Taxus chinensis]
MVVVGAIVGACFGGWLNDKFGRRTTILEGAIVFSLGSIVMACAPNVGMLIARRFVAGLGVGVASVTSPLYISEISPVEARGALVSLNSVLITGGQFLSYLINYFLAKGKKALEVLRRIYLEEQSEIQLRAMQESIEAEGEEQSSIKYSDLWNTKEIRLALVAGVGLQALPGDCLSLDAFSQDMCNAKSRAWYEVGCPSKIGWLAVLGMALYMITFSTGMGSVPWVLNAEIYPTKYNGVCSGIAASACWICNLIVAQTFLTMTNSIGTAAVFFLFGCFALMGLLFVQIFVPETKGLTFEQVEQKLKCRAQRPFFSWRKERNHNVDPSAPPA